MKLWWSCGFGAFRVESLEAFRAGGGKAANQFDCRRRDSRVSKKHTRRHWQTSN